MPILPIPLENSLLLYYNYNTAKYFGVPPHTKKQERKEKMKLEKLPYEAAKLNVTVFESEDIVTASVADNFDYVDQDAWDS